MFQVLDCNLFLYADDSCLMCQNRDVKATEQKLNKIFLNVCNRFANNKLSIYFGKDKTKSILSDTKKRLKKTAILMLDMAQYISNNTKMSHTFSYHQENQD